MPSIDPPHRVRPPLLQQMWCEMTFLHWAYDPADVRPLVDRRLELDLHDGLAWVSLTPLQMRGVHPPGLPSTPWLSRFPETNLRTYVRTGDGRDGLWFLSLDAARLPVVAGGRSVYGVPYHWSAMSIDRGDDTVRYRCRRRTGAASHDIVVRPGAPWGDQRELDVWLTARWWAFGTLLRRVTAAPVEHERWRLQQASVERLDETITRAAGLPPPSGDPLVHYSPGVRNVALGPPRPL